MVWKRWVIWCWLGLGGLGVGMRWVGEVSSHGPNQPPFFKINGVFNDYHPIQISSEVIDVPPDYFSQNFVAGQKLEMEIVKDLIPEKGEMVERLRFVWSFGDGGVFEGFKTTHAYKKPGMYPLLVRVIYPEGKEMVAVRADLAVLPQDGYELPKFKIDKIKDEGGLRLTAATVSGTVSRVIWDINNEGKEGMEQKIEVNDDYGALIIARGFDANGFFSDEARYVNYREPESWVAGKGNNKNNWSERVFDLFRRPKSDWWLVAAVGVVFAAGAVHALTPGHGKSILSAYLAGRSGTKFFDLVVIAAALTLTHTAVILVLGFALLVVDTRAQVEHLSGTIQRLGAMIVLYLAYRMYWGAKRSQGVVHNHGFGLHSHVHPQIARIQSKKDVMLAGISGGVIPCLDAFAIMLLAASSGQALLGLFLVLIFSLGLASMVLLLGVILLSGKGILLRSDKFAGAVSKWGTYAASVVIAAVAVTMFFRV